MPVRVVIAPTAFKGSLTPGEAAYAMQQGVMAAWPDAKTILCPIADGGDGTALVVVAAHNGTFQTVPAVDALDRPIDGHIGWFTQDGQRTAIIDMADTVGMGRLETIDLNPRHASTYGFGMVIAAALDQRPDRLLLGLGGSATMDGGAGMLAALGATIRDRHNQPVKSGALGVSDAAAILDLNSVRARFAGIEVRALCDVITFIAGSGAVEDNTAYEFGLQKGATREQLPWYDRTLTNWAALLERESGLAMIGKAYTGSAGGTGAALAAAGVILQDGANQVLDLLQFADLLEQSDLVLSGEGKIDNEWSLGKAISGVVEGAGRNQIPCILFAGSITLTASERKFLDSRITRYTSGYELQAIHSLTQYTDADGTEHRLSTEYAMQNAAALLTERVKMALTQM